jgi:hypothetical protein
MIPNNELSEGAWVYPVASLDKDETKFMQAAAKKVTRQDIGNMKFKANPIALTAQILDKCPQFKKDVSSGGNTVTYSFGAEWLIDCWKDGTLYIIGPISKPAPKYLHNFQNLFYLLTDGKDLIVKL